jgi:hypothetical protein
LEIIRFRFVHLLSFNLVSPYFSCLPKKSNATANRQKKGSLPKASAHTPNAHHAGQAFPARKDFFKIKNEFYGN